MPQVGCPRSSRRRDRRRNSVHSAFACYGLLWVDWAQASRVGTRHVHGSYAAIAAPVRIVQSESCVHWRAAAARPTPPSSVHAIPEPASLAMPQVPMAPPVPVPASVPMPPVPNTPPVPVPAAVFTPPAPPAEPSTSFPALREVLPQAPAHPTNRQTAQAAKPNEARSREVFLALILSFRGICPRNSNMRATCCRGSPADAGARMVERACTGRDRSICIPSEF